MFILIQPHKFGQIGGETVEDQSSNFKHYYYRFDLNAENTFTISANRGTAQQRTDIYKRQSESTVNNHTSGRVV